MPPLPSIHLIHPLGLLLLAALIPALVLLARGSRAYLPPARRRLALGLRLAVAALLCLAIVAPTVRGSADRLAVAFLVDRSDSISPAERQQQEDWLHEALGAMQGDDKASVIVFGAEPLVERQLSGDRSLGQIGSIPPAGGTDLAAAIRLAMATLPGTWARKIVVLSDGNENLGDARDEAALARAAGVPISVVPVAPQGTSEVLVSEVQAPSVLREGETFSVAVGLESSGSTHVKLHLLSDGRVVGEQEADLSAGHNSLAFSQQPLGKGFHSLQVQVEARDDTFAENNQGGAFVVVRGRPHVLVVEDAAGEGRFVTSALKAAGLDVDLEPDTTAPLTETALRNYDSVVLVDVPASRLSDTQMQALQSYVRDFGGGLVATGGPHAFTVGSYARTPLEDALPVRMELQGQTAASSVAMVLAIDTSGSMAGGPFGASKIDLAKEAALQAATLLGQYDRLGVVAFEESPRWAMELQPLTDMQRAQQEIGSMSPGGGTNIYPALDEAYRALATTDAKVKHVILLTDGITPVANWNDLTFRYNQAHITLSTIAIGNDADKDLLKQLAEQGKGRYYEGNDPYDLPRLVVKETQQVAKAAIVEGAFKAVQVSSSPLLDGFTADQLPPLRGYVATSPKPATQVVLASGHGDPILSEWQYGLGRTIAWTSDATNRWSSDWIDWGGFSQFWAQVVKRTLPPAADPNRQITVTQDGADAHITVDAMTDQRQFVNFARTTAQVTRPDGQRRDVPLTQSAPGRYEGRFPAQSEGAYYVEVVQQDARGKVLSSQPGGYVVPYSAEYRARDTNRQLLSDVAALTGGTMLATPAAAFAHDIPATGQPWETWPLLLALAALLFLLDVAARRLRMGWADVRPLLRGARARWLEREAEATAALPAVRRAHAAVVADAADVALGAPMPPLGGGLANAVTDAPLPDPASASGRSARLLAAKRRARGASRQQ